MYTSIQQKPATNSEVFRWFARACGAILFGMWLGLVLIEVTNHGSPPSATYPQAVALAIVFIGYAVGWRNELVGGLTAILGTAAFFIVPVFTTPAATVEYMHANRYMIDLAAVWFAFPGVLYLLAWYYNERRTTSK